MTPLLDRTLAFFARGYDYFLAKRLRQGTDTMRLRLLGRPTTVVSGPDGTRLFYDETAMWRRNAVPAALSDTLFGKGAVHGLDDAEHKQRKAMFLTVLTPDSAREVAALAADRWARIARDWTNGHEVTLFSAAAEVHAGAICEWAGVPLARLSGTVARDLIATVDGFGSVGPRAVEARRARRRSDAWASEMITHVRSGRVHPPAGSALRAVAEHRDETDLLTPSVAGVELLNVLRPTVAVAYFVCFVALALNEDATLRDRLATGDGATLEAFAHEVRRHYPFVPALAARTRRDVPWRGSTIPAGERVLLDVYGTLHDPAMWTDPDRFDISRFHHIEPDPWLFIPQGGGDVATGHRCPGERVAIELIKVAARFLTGLEYRLTAQDLSVRLSRMPARPASGVRLCVADARGDGG